MGLGIAKAIRDSNKERRGIIEGVQNVNEGISKYQDDKSIARTIINTFTSLIPGGPLVKAGINAGLQYTWYQTKGKEHREAIDAAAQDIETAGGTASDGSAKFHISERQTQVSDTIKALESIEDQATQEFAMDTGAKFIEGIEYKKSQEKQALSAKTLLDKEEGYGMALEDVTAGYRFIDEGEIVDIGGENYMQHDIYKGIAGRSFHEGWGSGVAKWFGDDDWDAKVDKWFGGKRTIKKKI